jgi:AcrR family transcriptional regulator
MPIKKKKQNDATGPGQGATKADLLEGARTLYVEGGWTLAKIAEALGVHPNTLTRWKDDGQWEEIKAARVGGRHEIERRMLRQTLRLIELIDRDQDGIPTLAQSNTLLNYKKFMEGLKPELTLTILVEAGVSFTTWAAANYPEQSQMLFKLWDEFISTYIAKGR